MFIYFPLLLSDSQMNKNKNKSAPSFVFFNTQQIFTENGLKNKLIIFSALIHDNINSAWAGMFYWL